MQARETALSEYKGLDPRWHEWEAVKAACGRIAVAIFDRNSDWEIAHPEEGGKQGYSLLAGANRGWTRLLANPRNPAIAPPSWPAFEDPHFFRNQTCREGEKIIALPGRSRCRISRKQRPPAPLPAGPLR
jgi:hypothetical protein